MIKGSKKYNKNTHQENPNGYLFDSYVTYYSDFKDFTGLVMAVL
jgi:hypothetical protein